MKVKMILLAASILCLGGLAMSDDAKLTPEQYHVTRENGTEPAFHNAYWNNHEEGLYVDVVSGKPLFSSKDKFDSGTGWPSFTRPADPAEIVEKTDRSLFMKRTEVRSKTSDAHLGHVFEDGPAPTGLRYCINSASLRFIPQKELGTATFAAGCFWHVQEAFDSIPGVLVTRAGFTGGRTKDPTYKQVCSHTTGHAEAVEVVFDPKKVSYSRLLEEFFRLHPRMSDAEDQYRGEIFVRGEAQRAAAKAALGGREGVARITDAGAFYPAEDYHQKYYAKQRGVCPSRS